MSLVSQPSTSTAASSSTWSSPSGHADNGESSSPSTPLRPITTSSGFIYPAIWSFPPFFTLQPNPSTQAHQISLWIALILNWGRHQRVFSVNVDSPENGAGVFGNKAINRKLQTPAVRTILDQMVKEGTAALDPPKQTSTYLLYWRKPVEWGNLIYDWVSENGLKSSIMTFYEITEGDLSHTTDFYELPVPILRKALDTLVKSRRAQLLKGEGEDGDGVRFL